MQTYQSNKKPNWKEVQKITDELESFRHRIEESLSTHKQKLFLQVMGEFWDFIRNFQDIETYNLFQSTEYFTKHKGFFKRAEDYYERALETDEAMNLCNKKVYGDDPSISYYSSKELKSVYADTLYDLELIDTDNCKNLVFVGCGPLPNTIIYLHENLKNTNIVGIDNNQEAVYMAGKVIRSLGMKRVDILYQDGKSYDYSNADAVLIANFVSPKNEILKRIADTGKNSVQIMARTPRLLGNIIYEKAEHGLDFRLNIAAKGTKTPTTDRLLLKKLSAES